MPALRDVPHDAGRAVGRWWTGRRPRRVDLKADVVAGLPGAVSSVPDGMAAAVLAGVNPVHGLYASVAGPITGGLTSSSRMMVITTTSAAALAAGSAVQSVPADDRSKALLLPVAAAVAVGVGVSLVLQLNQDAVDLRVVRLRPVGDGRFDETEAPARLTDGEIVVLDVYGSLFYAGAHTLERRLPEVAGARRTAVVLRLRGRSSLGSTFLTVIGAYAARLAAGGGRLYLTGLDPAVAAHWDDQRFPLLAAGITLRAATPLIGESTLDAVLDAETRVVGAPAAQSP